jgi:hypothetical protein
MTEPHENNLRTSLPSLSKILKNTTLFFARRMPTLANVIPAMDHIHTTIKQINPRCVGLQWVCYLVNDSSISDRSIVLHPQYTLNYFEIAGWEQDWIDTAEQITGGSC